MTQDGDGQTKKEEESLPEVEAELVSETPPPADAFEDDAPASPAPPDADDGDADGAKAGKRKSTLTPGVMVFLAFVVVALIIFGVWRLQMQRGAETQSGETAPAVEEAVANGPPVQAAPSAETTAPEIMLETAPEAAAPQAKIENLSDDDLTPPAAPEDSGGYLPPVTEGRAAKIGNSVEEGAKEAMRRFSESAGAEIPPTDEMMDAPLMDAGAAEEDDPASAAPEAPAEETVTQTPPPVEQEQAAGPADESAAASAANEDAAVALQSEMEAMRAAFEEERARLSAELENANTQMESQRQEIINLRAELENRDSAASDEIASLRAALQQTRNDEAQQSAQQMKASFALAALSRAVDQGDSFTEELAAIEKFEPRAAATLEAHAQTGVATDAALRLGFDEAARKALSAAGQAEAGGGVSGLMARAKSLVSVRPAMPVSGDDPGAVLSRAEHALEEGEISFALLQLEDLPLPAQEAMADWIAAARARAEAEAGVAALTASLSGETE